MKWLRKYKGEELAEGESLMVEWDSMSVVTQMSINRAENNGNTKEVERLERAHTWVVID